MVCEPCGLWTRDRLHPSMGPCPRPTPWQASLEQRPQVGAMPSQREAHHQLRRRLATLAVFAAAMVIVALALTAALGGAHHHSPQTPAATPSLRSSSTQLSSPSPSARAVSHLVRNARPQPGWRRDTGPVPILVYHALGSPPASEPYPGLYVAKAEFVAQMRWLADNRYQAVTLDEVMSAWYQSGTLPAKPIVITFDNGYPEQATFAPAVLSRYGWPGVLNEITAGHLHPVQLRHLVALGWEIDSHSVTPHHAESRAAALPERRQPPLPAASARRAGEQLLLPVEQVRRRSGRRSACRRLLKRHDRERGLRDKGRPLRARPLRDRGRPGRSGPRGRPAGRMRAAPAAHAAPIRQAPIVTYIRAARDRRWGHVRRGDAPYRMSSQVQAGCLRRTSATPSCAA